MEQDFADFNRSEGPSRAGAPRPLYERNCSIAKWAVADLIAVGCEIFNNPNWPMDAALKLGVEA